MNPSPANKRPASYWVHRRCSDCGKEVPAEDKDGLMVRIVLWRTVGAGGKTKRSRSQKYQCRECVELDPVWNKEKHADAPGYQDIPRA